MVDPLAEPPKGLRLMKIVYENMPIDHRRQAVHSSATHTSNVIRMAVIELTGRKKLFLSIVNSI